MNLILLISFLLTYDVAHEFHLSNTEIRYNIEESALQITTRIFIDDLEDALKALGGENLFICTEKEAPDAESFIKKYLNTNLIVTVDGKSSPFTFIGKEISDDLLAVWCYMEIEDIVCNEVVSIENNVLLELFDDQKNIVRLKFDSGQQEMFILERGKSKGTLQL